MSDGNKNPRKKTIAVLIEDGAVTSYLMERLTETFNENARVIRINSRDIRENNILQQTDILFIPGVRKASEAYRNGLGDEGGEKIRKWVQGGGTVVGLCQGAYLLTETFQYTDKYSNETRTIHPATGIFEGTAFGPIPQYTNWNDHENPFADHAVAKLEFNDAASGAACYAHGPWLELSETADPSEYKIIARFADVAGKPVAIASRQYGNGKAIFSGVVPEISGVRMAQLDDRLIPGNDRAAEHCRAGIRYARDLAAHERERQLAWNRLIAEIKPD